MTESSPPQAGLWGVAGPAVGQDGTIYFEAGDGTYDAATGKLASSVQAFTFSDDRLTLKDYYTPTNYVWLTRRDLDMNVTPSCFLTRAAMWWWVRQGRPVFPVGLQVAGRGRPPDACLPQRSDLE